MNYQKIIRKINRSYDKVAEIAFYPVSHEQLGSFDFWHKEKPIMKASGLPYLVAARDYSEKNKKVNTKIKKAINEAISEVEKGFSYPKDVNGEIYPCKPDIFNKTYEPIPNRLAQ